MVSHVSIFILWLAPFYSGILFDDVYQFFKWKSEVSSAAISGELGTSAVWRTFTSLLKYGLLVKSRMAKSSFLDYRSYPTLGEYPTLF
jgi:hypothetical protein